MLHSLENFCHRLPEAQFDLKWGDDRTYCIAGKMFAVFCTDSRADNGMTRLCIKVSPADFLALTDRDGILPAPYLARYHWISIEDRVLSQKELETLIQGSYDMVLSKLSKKKQQELLNVNKQ